MKKSVLPAEHFTLNQGQISQICSADWTDLPQKCSACKTLLLRQWHSYN